MSTRDNQPNSTRPAIFIGSSSEAEDIVDALTELLGAKGDLTIHPWRASFELTDDSLSSLVNELERADFGVFVFHPDDEVLVRGKTLTATRDNVVLEYGMFLGGLGRNRAIGLLPRIKDQQVPSDVAGIKFASYPFDPTIDFNTNADVLNPAVSAIRRHIKKVTAAAAPPSETTSVAAKPDERHTPTPSPIEDGWQFMLRHDLLRPLDEADTIRLGLTVVHPLLGAGRVVGFDPPGTERTITVEFGDFRVGVYLLHAAVILTPRV